MISNAISYAHQGIQQGMERFEQAAADIADPATGIQVSSIADLKRAEHEVAINAQVIKVANQTTEHLIDIVA